MSWRSAVCPTGPQGELLAAQSRPKTGLRALRQTELAGLENTGQQVNDVIKYEY
jgi:hypothetical protein